MVDEELLEESKNDIYKCPGCGANLTYNTSNQSLHCEYCDYSLVLEGTHSTEENDFLASIDSLKNIEEVKKAVCKNCGATIIINSQEITSNCPFCDTSIVVSTENIKGLKPDRVIPFNIDPNESKENYRLWLKKRFFAPRKLKKEIPNPNIYSVYVPSWTFDTNVIGSYEGRLGKRYTTYVGSGKNRRAVTRTRWFRIKGVHQKIVDDVLICSGKQIEQKEMIKIEPFETNDSFVFDNRYIVGHTTEHYSIDLNTGWKMGQNRILEQMKREILSKYNYDVIDYIKIYPNYNNIKYKYVLLPIWIGHYFHHKKKFRFLVNGESGKVWGKTPISALKISILVLLGIAVLLLIFYAFSTSGFTY